MNALCLAMLCVANFAAYEKKVLADAKGGAKLGKYLPLEDFGLGFRVQGLGGVGVGVWGLGFRGWGKTGFI